MINNISSVRAANQSQIARNNSLSYIPDTMLTKGRSNLSDAEFDKKIMDLARRDVAAGTNSKFIESGRGTSRRSGSDEWRKLQDDYMSSVSPNRKGIVNNTLSKLAERMGSIGIGFNSFNFFQALFKNSQLFGNFGDFGNGRVGATFVEFKDNNGNLIASFSEKRGWITYTTPAEDGRRQDFLAKWDEALARATAELKSGEQVKQIQNTDIIIDKKV
jgi:hypothetical protein